MSTIESNISSLQDMEHCEFEGITVLPYSRLTPDTRVKLKGGPVFPSDAPSFVRHHRRKAVDEMEYAAGEPDDMVALSGTYLYAGPLFTQFDHFMTESCHRLWAGRWLHGKFDGVLFAGTREQSDELRDYPDFIREVLAYFAISPDSVKIIAKPARVARLMVPPQGSALYKGAGEEYLEVLERIADGRFLAQGMPKKVYVTRAHVITEGSFLGEEYLADQLASEGYFILTPEMATLEKVWEYYSNAEKLIFSEGSAIHAMELLPRVKAEVLVIGRNRMPWLADTVLKPRCRVLHVFGDTTPVGGIPAGRKDGDCGIARVNICQLVRLIRKTRFAKLAKLDFPDFRRAEAWDILRYIEGTRLQGDEKLWEQELPLLLKSLGVATDFFRPYCRALVHASAHAKQPLETTGLHHLKPELLVEKILLLDQTEYQRSPPLHYDLEGVETGLRNILEQEFHAPTKLVPPVYLCKFENAKIDDNGILVLEGKYLLSETVSDYPISIDIDTRLGALQFRKDTGIWSLANEQHLTVCRQPVLSLMKHGYDNYGHWLVELLPRLKLALEYLPDNFCVAVGNTEGKLWEVVLDTLRGLGVGPERTIRITGMTQVNTLYYVSPVTSHPVYISPYVPRFLAEIYTTPMPVAKPRRRLYVSRRDARFRRLINEAELLDLLVPLGFEVVLPGQMSFKEQVACFAEAEIIVAVMGAALTNMVFAPGHATIIALLPVTMGDLFFWGLACLKGQRYYELRGPAVSNMDTFHANLHTDFMVEPQEVFDLLKTAVLEPA